MAYELTSTDGAAYDDPTLSKNGARVNVTIPDEPAYATRSTRGARCVFVMVLLDRFFTAALSVVVTAVMAFTFETYAVHRNLQMNGMQPFGAAPRLWPTIMMLSIGAATMLYNVVQVVAYFFGRNVVQRIASLSNYVKLLSPIGHVIAWTASAVAFKAASNNQDLWGFSCAETPSIVQIQQQFEKTINYDRLCVLNTNSWYISIATAVFAAFSVLVWIVVTIFEFSHKQQAKVKKTKYESYRQSDLRQ